MKLIESDFLEFIDGETQLAIGATFDMSIRDRLRVVMKFMHPDMLTQDDAEELRAEARNNSEELDAYDEELAEAQERIAELEAELAGLKTTK